MSSIENDEKRFDLFDQTCSELIDKTDELHKQLRIYSKNKNDQNRKNTIFKNFEQTRREMQDLLRNHDNIICIKKISSSIDFDLLIDNIENEMNMDKIEIEKLFPKTAWKFDYIYDYKYKGEKQHCIENNGKRIVCNHHAWSWKGCDCYYCCYSFALKPESGKYKIEIKIDNISSISYANIIGIISHNSKKAKIENESFDWCNQFCDYIGWSARGGEDDKYLPNGLFCGYNELSIKNNIFRNNNFVYKSNNENYRQRLPPITKGDIIMLSYDSDNGILSFSKNNDYGKLNAQIYNLPKMETYYWFVGHHYGEMSLSVVS